MYKVFSYKHHGGGSGGDIDIDDDGDADVPKKGAATRSVLSAFLRRKSLIVAHHVAVGTVLTPLMATRLGHDPGELMVACALVMEGR